MAKRKSIEQVLKEQGGIRLDLGCGDNKQPGFTGLDKRDLPEVDIVHDLEEFPYPLPDESCLMIMGTHIIEHIKPWLTLQMWDEFWRILKPGGQMALVTPYGQSEAYIQDPTHCNPYNAQTFQYWDWRYPLWEVYKPKPWITEEGFPIWRVNGNLEVIMNKVTEEDAKKIDKYYDPETLELL